MKFEIIYVYAGADKRYSIICKGPYMLAGSLSVLTSGDNLEKVTILDILKY